MDLTPDGLVRLIDISAVRAEHSELEIKKMADYAITHRFIAVHVLPCWVPYLKELLQGQEDVLIGAPVGFPAGAHKTVIKAEEARLLVQDGVQEMDMMINIGKLRAGQYQYVEDEIRSVVEAVDGIPVKVIIEAHYLTNDEIKKACELCIRGKAAYVKTSTGMAPTGATLENVKLITSVVGNNIQVKAAGGIRDFQTISEMYRMGVTRFGINVHAAISIVENLKKNRHS